MMSRGSLRVRGARGQTCEGARRRALLAFIVVVALASVSLLSGCGLFKAPALNNDPKNIFNKVKPATVMIYGEVSASVSSPDWILDWDYVLDDVLVALQQGAVSNDEAALESYACNLICQYPEDYIVSYRGSRQAAGEFTVTGSGFIVDPDGYVVTNAHVATNSEEDLKYIMLNYGLQEWVEEDVGYLSGLMPMLSEDELWNLFYTVAEYWYLENLELENLQESYYVLMGSQVAGLDTGTNLIPATVVEYGEPAPGKDVAILKIDADNLPTIPLADDKDVSPGDDCYAIGYPADATFHPYLSEEAVSEPSFTAGKISARKQGAGGFEVIQMDAAVTYGNSGGPVVDSEGRVIGLATFITVGDTGQTEGFNFVLPTSIMEEFIDRAGAEPGVSSFTEVWEEALAEEAASHYKRALELYKQLDTMSPGHPYVVERIQATTRAISEGKDKSTSVGLVIGIVVVFLLVIAAAAVVVLLMLRRKKRAKPGVVAATAGAPQPAAPPAAPPVTAPPAAPPAAPPVAPAPPPAAQVAPEPPVAAPEPEPPVAPEPPTAPEPEAPEPPAADVHPDALEQLKKLAELKDAGIITQDEFDEKKSKLLGEI